MSKVKARESAQAMLPDNTDIKAQLSLARGQVAGLSTSLQAAVSMMSKLDMQTAEYREQIIHSTGEISTETVNAEVFGKLVQDWWQRFVDTMAREGPALLLNLFLFFVIILAALKLANIVARVTEAGLDKSQVNLSHLLRNMVLSVVRKLVLALGLLIALSQIGISLGPVLAGLGVAGFVIGFAMQDTLSNFASGMMILLYRPFDTGDVVEAGGVAGTVSNMSLVSTTILTFDNQTLVVPNNKIWGDVIKNVTSQRMRRVDLMFGVSYEDDIAKTERVLAEIVESDLRVLKTPAPVIKLHQLADSSVNFIVRPWVKTEDYWNVYWDLTRAVKLRFDEEHISIPYPQRDVHLDGIQLSQAAAAAD
jgi:small conductance mechanosensitive channel